MSFEFFGFSQEELLVYACVALSFILSIYIIHVAKSKSKQEEQAEQQTSQTTLELTCLLRDMFHYFSGVNPTSHNPTAKPTPEQTKNEIIVPPSTVEQDEEDYVPTEEDKKILARVGKHLQKKKTRQGRTRK